MGSMGPVRACARRAAQIFGNAVLASLSLAAGMLVIELILRAATGGLYLDRDLRIQRGPRGLTHLPNQEQVWRRPEWDVHIRINSRGLRDYEPRAKARRAVLALGDSFTEGWGVQLDETYAKRLEAAVRRRQPGDRVLIGGAHGLNPFSYFRMYEDYFRSDRSVGLVLMQFYVGNDIETEPRSGYSTPSSREVFTYRVKRLLSEHCVLYNFLRRPVKLSRRFYELAMRLGISYRLGMDPIWADPARKPAWEFTAGLLRDFQREVRADGREFALFLIPCRVQVEDDYFDWLVRVAQVDPRTLRRFEFNAFMRDFARRNGIALLDLTEVFREAYRKGGRPLYFRTDSHWTPAGHALAAGELERFLRARGFLRRLDARPAVLP